MIRGISYLFCLACLVGLVGCQAISISHYQLSSLNKGMARTEVATKLQPGPRASATAQVGSRSFSFESYLMNNGVQVDHYVLAYEGDRLVYWGYISEFRKLQDADLVAAVNKAYPSLVSPK